MKATTKEQESLNRLAIDAFTRCEVALRDLGYNLAVIDEWINRTGRKRPPTQTQILTLLGRMPEAIKTLLREQETEISQLQTEITRLRAQKRKKR